MAVELGSHMLASSGDTGEVGGNKQLISPQWSPLTHQQEGPTPSSFHVVYWLSVLHSRRRDAATPTTR